MKWLKNKFVTGAASVIFYAYSFLITGRINVKFRTNSNK